MRSRPITPLSVIAVFCVQLTFVPIIHSQSSTSGRNVIEGRDPRLQRIAEPPELTGEPKPKPKPSTPAELQFAESDVRALFANPHDPQTLGPAVVELNRLIRIEPDNSYFYFLRATVSCHLRAKSTGILDDISHAISFYRQSTDEYKLRDDYALRAKIQFEGGHFEDAMRDLDAAIKEDYDSANYVFQGNIIDENPKPSSATHPCMWSQADFDILQRRFPNDYRPSLYRGLYLMSIYKLNAESDCTPVLDAFRLAATLNPASPLPEFFIGELYSPIGATDESQRSAVRSLTAAIALDPKFGPAYALRAEAFSNLKEYRQAIRDYGKVLELTPTQKATEVAYSDRGLAKLESGEYQSAIEDFTQAIAIGCKAEWCNSSFSHFHRAEAYMKLHDYRRAVEDFTASIKTDLSYGLLLMNIDKFRQIYPEYDSVPDDSLCEKVRALFFPGMRYSDFAKEFLIGAKTYSPPTILTESYVRRGDAYSALNRMRKANVEYDRISRAFPDDVKFWFVDVKGKRVRRSQ